MSTMNTQMEEKRQRIMDVALELFSEEGYHSVSISRIAKQAGMSKGNTYNYFKSKQDLLVQLVMEGLDELFQEFDPNHDGVLTEEEFYHFIEKLFDNIKARQPFWKLMFSLLLQPRILELLENDLEPIGERSVGILSSFFVNNGSEDPYTDLLFFSSLTKGAIMQYVYSPESIDIDKLKNKIISYYKNECNH
ncbi:MAG: TetR/AcrR family transcriptional regulator [Bacteroidales bacterium]